MSVGDEKSLARSRVLTRRRSQPEAACDYADQLLRQHLVSELSARGARMVAAYAPMAREPGGAGLPQALWEAGVRVLLPVLRPDRGLEWAEYTADSSLVTTVSGVLEVVGSRLPGSVLAEVSAVVVPALAVDRRGIRLGRGGGSYDRALRAVPAGVPVTALLYDGEAEHSLPAEGHDARVTHVVTPRGGWQAPSEAYLTHAGLGALA